MGIAAVCVGDPDVVVGAHRVRRTALCSARMRTGTHRATSGVHDIDALDRLDEARLVAAVGIHHPDLAVVLRDVSWFLEPRRPEDIEPGCGQHGRREQTRGDGRRPPGRRVAAGEERGSQRCHRHERQADSDQHAARGEPVLDAELDPTPSRQATSRTRLAINTTTPAPSDPYPGGKASRQPRPRRRARTTSQIDHPARAISPL